MNDSRSFGTSQFKQHAFVWKSVFEERRSHLYSSDDKIFVEERRENQPSTEDIIDKVTNYQCSDDIDRYLYRNGQIAGFLQDVTIDVLRQEQHSMTGFRPMALIDDRNDGNATRLNPSGNVRPSRPLNAREFYVELRKPRISLNQEPAVQLTVPDAERRLIYITDLDPLCVLALIATVSERQAAFLREFIHKHLAYRAMIGVNILSTFFALEFHLPYYAWRSMQSEQMDSRKRADRKALRRSEEVIHLDVKGHDLEIDPELKDYIYEAQISVMITGMDNYFWTGYCFVDTYFKDQDDNRERVEHYCNSEQKLDPTSCGRMTADRPIWTPREYFLRTLSFRMDQVKQEWNNAVVQLIEQIEPHIHSFTREDTGTRSSHGLNITQQKGFKWTIRILRQFTNLISKTIDTWETFKDGEIRYFYSPESEQLAQAHWGDLLAAIDKDVTDLKDLRRSLYYHTELFENMTNSLATHAALRATHAALVESKTARQQNEFIQALTVITILYLPPSLTATIFSMQSTVFPGDATFTAWLITLTILIATTAVLIVNLPQIMSLVRKVRKLQKQTLQRLRGRWKDSGDILMESRYNSQDSSGHDGESFLEEASEEFQLHELSMEEVV
ncbi:hypothetical protein BP5796_10776 [Coleophoma crateriformis]|uniref:Uncharacterized protein n=1 Tax=Coleophoma crateriformis TaxID=565419 RepID=A0A3D8QS09_9HELO|nr:hypothetical protein BP5796_10776 [Coleophoma crateriformis]